MREERGKRQEAVGVGLCSTRSTSHSPIVYRKLASKRHAYRRRILVERDLHPQLSTATLSVTAWMPSRAEQLFALWLAFISCPPTSPHSYLAK